MVYWVRRAVHLLFIIIYFLFDWGFTPFPRIFDLLGEIPDPPPVCKRACHLRAVVELWIYRSSYSRTIGTSSTSFCLTVPEVRINVCKHGIKNENSCASKWLETQAFDFQPFDQALFPRTMMPFTVPHNTQGCSFVVLTNLHGGLRHCLRTFHLSEEGRYYGGPLAFILMT